jgi:hypothetical protein
VFYYRSESSLREINMQNVRQENLDKVIGKLEEFMRYCQKLKPNDTYLIVNRNASILAEAAKKAAENFGLNVNTFNLNAHKPYHRFPRKLIKMLHKETPKAGMGLFDYSENPDWNLKEVGARVELLHKTIEEVPISWAHSPGITLDMAINGPLQCDYKRMAEEAEKILQKLRNVRKLTITAPRGTDIEIEIPEEVKFDTDCIIVPPNVYGKPGKFGNLPVGEVWAQKSSIIRVLNRQMERNESQSYPIKLNAKGKVVCDVTVGGYMGRINPEKPIIAQFKDGVLTSLKCEDPALNCIREDILASERTYGLPTIAEEVGIGLNERARITGNMLEDEKLRGTCHIAPGNIRCHVDMLIDKPTITATYHDGTSKEIMKDGVLIL